MKKIFKIAILLITILLLNSRYSVAQSNYGGISNFEIPSQYLIDGKLKVNTNSSTVTFDFRVQFYRVQNPNSGPTYLFTTINAKISSPNSSNTPVFYGGDNIVTDADFGTNELFIWKTFSVTINRSSLAAGKPIFLAYITANMPSAAVYSKSYQWQSYPPPPPPIPPSNEGKLMQTNDGKVYSIFDGQARHIQNFDTLVGVYNYSGNIVVCNCSTLTVSTGAPIGGDTSLLRDNNDSKLYFREGTYLRHITSVPIANQYYFKINYNESNIAKVYGLSGYTVGPPIQ